MNKSLAVELQNNIFFNEIFKDMQHQFPLEELKSFSEFQDLLEKGKYKLYKLSNNNNFVGYFVALVNDSTKMIWLDYLAIKKEFHSNGYGTKLFEELKKVFAEYNGIFLEVEMQDDKNINTIRRQKFYNKVGAQKLDFNYIFPTNDGGISMNLFFFPLIKKELKKDEILAEIKHTFNYIHKNISLAPKIFEKIEAQN